LPWSPVQISRWLKKLGPAVVSHETIYQYLWKDKLKQELWYKNIRHSGKKYNKLSQGLVGRGGIPNGMDIDERPVIVEKKVGLGDWELDLIIGTEQSRAIVSMVDRASKLTKLIKVSKNTAPEAKTALIERLDPVKKFVLTLTSDNGKEFSKPREASDFLQSEFYFAKPCQSWERGLNEHTNGLVRQYFPKSKRLDEISVAGVMKVGILLNNRPRKVLDFARPIEIFSRFSEAT